MRGSVSAWFRLLGFLGSFILIVLITSCESLREMGESKREEAHDEPEPDHTIEGERAILESLGAWTTPNVPIQAGLSSPPPGPPPPAAPPPVSSMWTSIGPQPVTYDTNYGVQTWSGRVN